MALVAKYRLGGAALWTLAMESPAATAELRKALDSDTGFAYFSNGDASEAGEDIYQETNRGTDRKTSGGQCQRRQEDRRSC